VVDEQLAHDDTGEPFLERWRSATTRGRERHPGYVRSTCSSGRDGLRQGAGADRADGRPGPEHQWQRSSRARFGRTRPVGTSTR
jgi:hypothetical protein